MVEAETEVSVSSLTDGIARGRTFCGQKASESLFLLYPTLERLWTSFSTVEEVLDGMDQGVCVAAVLFKDGWRKHKSTMSVHGENAGKVHCETKQMLPGAVFFQGNAIPVSDELQLAMGWAVSAAITQGGYEASKQAALLRFAPEDETCSQIDLALSLANSKRTRLEIKDAGGTVLVTLAIVTLGLLIHIVGEVLRWRRRRKLTIHERILEPPSLVELLSPRLKKARSEAAEQAALDTRSHAYNNDDMMVVAQMVHAVSAESETQHNSAPHRSPSCIALSSCPPTLPPALPHPCLSSHTLALRTNTLALPCTPTGPLISSPTGASPLRPTACHHQRPRAAKGRWLWPTAVSPRRYPHAPQARQVSAARRRSCQCGE